METILDDGQNVASSRYAELERQSVKTTKIQDAPLTRHFTVLVWFMC